MAAMIFARVILAGEPIDDYNHGGMQRDFTDINGIVSGVLAVLDRLPAADDGVRHRVDNIGNHHPEPLLCFVEVLDEAFGERRPPMKMLPMRPGDSQATYADIDAQQRDYGRRPTTIASRAEEAECRKT
jgi:UDP-glucuronate 4-epimerase